MRRATLPSLVAMLLNTAGLVDGRPANSSSGCTEEFGTCTDTACCRNPGFGCYKRTDRHYARCMRKTPDCKDTDEWLCPGWEQCSNPYTDCRQSLCCNEPSTACFRKPHLYFAQCRHIEDKKKCKDTDDWLCPGWEKCAKAHEECTLSRCCQDKSFGCALNETLLASGGGWHAYCHPHPHPEEGKGLPGLVEGNHDDLGSFVAHGMATPASFSKFKGLVNTLKSTEMMKILSAKAYNSSVAARLRNHTSWLCELRPSEAMCKNAWKSSSEDYYAYANGLAMDWENRHDPLTVLGIVLLSVTIAICAIVALVLHRRRMQARVTQMELELHALRAFAKNEGKFGESQHQSLVADHA